jgi:hypothetical protein
MVALFEVIVLIFILPFSLFFVSLDQFYHPFLLPLESLLVGT